MSTWHDIVQSQYTNIHLIFKLCVRTDITGHNLQRVAIELLTYVIDIQRDLIAYYSFIKERNGFVSIRLCRWAIKTKC